MAKGRGFHQGVRTLAVWVWLPLLCLSVPSLHGASDGQVRVPRPYAGYTAFLNFFFKKGQITYYQLVTCVLGFSIYKAPLYIISHRGRLSGGNSSVRLGSIHTHQYVCDVCAHTPAALA